MFTSVFRVDGDASYFDEDPASSDPRSSLEYVINHVFFPAYHPQDNDHTPENAHALVGAVLDAARAYVKYVDQAYASRWLRIIKMLENLQVISKISHPWSVVWLGETLKEAKDLYRSNAFLQLGGMKAGDILVFPAHLYGDGGVSFRKQDKWTLCELFPMSRDPTDSKKTSYPELAIKVPNHVFDDEDIRSEIASSLSGKSIKPVTDILRNVGHLAEAKRVTKHVGPSRIVQYTHHRTRDDPRDWSRSDLWFLTKIAIQSSLDCAPLSDAVYKAFMLFFMCNLAAKTRLSSFLLHSMSAKILRRFRKLGPSVPQWLSNMVSHICTTLSRTLNQRWQEVQATQHSPPPWDLARLDLTEDIYHSLPHIHQYISISLANHGSDPPHTPFLSNSRLRGTLGDFLSDPNKFLSRPDKYSHHDDIHVTLYDIEQAVAEDIDDWVACVINVDKACEQLELFVYQYQSVAQDRYRHGKDVYDADHISIMFLTIIELWVALDKLTVREIPILADYSPEVPIDLLCGLLLRDALSIHRFCRAYQYLFARHARGHPRRSALSDELTANSFPCRYYDDSPQIQRLEARIKNLLPTNPSHAKAVVFELQRPVSFDAWRSVTSWISRIGVNRKEDEEDIRVCDIPALKAHILAVREHSLSLYSSHSAPQCWDRLYYIYQGSFLGRFEHLYKLPTGPYARSGLQAYLNDTTHMSNTILAAQANCDPDLSLHAFTAFAHLRSGGSLQWFNILRELRSKALDFRHQEVYLLFVQASAQVGPLDGTGELLWHQDLQDVSFCHALLDELDGLFLEVVLGSMDGPVMATISLLAGLLASRLSGSILERATQLLRNVRRKTFDWVQELLYDARRSPMNEESFLDLRDMAAVCRSTFDVGYIAGRRLLSVQDIEIALSCAMLISLNFPASSDVPTYSRVLLDRDRRLSLVLEGSLREAIRADTTDLGVDRAVQMAWPGYRPSPHRWESMDSPNSRWLVCETAVFNDKRSQTVHINLLDGSLLVDGKPVNNKLPRNMKDSQMYRRLFGSHDLMVVSSDLPGMDFVTMSVIHGHYVHFAVRNGDRACWPSKTIVVRAQRKGMGDIFEMVPYHVLEGDLPAPLVDGYVHWLNLTTSVIDIRPTEEPWEQSSDNWSIHLSSGRFHVTKGDEFLIDMQSPTWTMISRRLCSLSRPENQIVTVSPVSTAQSSLSQLSVTLPRYGLSFFANEVGQLESCDFKDMVYDEGQCIGTLFGLVSRLILRPKVQIEPDLVPKLVLIPYSDSLKQRGHNVIIGDPSFKPVSHYTYQVDTELGCLKGFVDLESRLYLARLHALTGGGCRPDLLTGRTGVEEGISLVWLAGTRRQAGDRYFRSQSPQMRFALAKIQNGTDHESELPSKDVLLQEAYLFPSEVTVGVQLPKPLEPLDQLFHGRPAPVLRERDMLPRRSSGSHAPSFPNIVPLRQLFSSLGTNGTAAPFQSQYISRLHHSAHCFQTKDSIGATFWSKSDTATLRKHYAQCRTDYTESLDTIKAALGPRTEFEQILDQCGQWPRVTPFVLFRCLASTSPIRLPDTWRKCLTSLALLALNVQRARRLLRFTLDNLEEEFYKELENEGCDGWDPVEHLDWLLIQLQGDFLIRRVQVDVANEMMSPRSGKNTVMQVNLGEGKTSVIIPICAAALANGKQLVRVIVPKPLIPQTIQLLTDRLSGLVNKPVLHLTFSRDHVNVTNHHRYTPPREPVGSIELLAKLIPRCRDECATIVMQPEHALSLKLACVEAQLFENGIKAFSARTVRGWGFKNSLYLLAGSLLKSLKKNTYVSTMLGRVRHCKPSTAKEENVYKTVKTNPNRARASMEIQRFLEAHARDILDESDDVLRPQFQLIYAIGHQHPFEGSPKRWDVIQEVLGLVKRHAYLLSTPDSHTIRCDVCSPGSFPHIHVLEAKGGEQLIALIAQDVLEKLLPNLSFHSELGFRGTIREFISRKDIDPDTAKAAESYARQSIGRDSLLLLRGLLAHDILLFALTQRRWRVDYGLDPRSPPRTILAIPYRAKDVPAEAAEFGHPDVTILLTCLSYYYGGLDEGQLRISFELLLRQDDPASEYALWLEDYDTGSVPSAFRKLSGINIRSFEQWNKLFFPLFSRNKKAIDLYLSKVVFAKYAKEFPQRILGSYWDLAEQKKHLVTGFSGTNDGQYLLPTSITQDDPDHLRQVGTNARVLAYLLQAENSSYMVTIDGSDECRTTPKLLSMMVAQNPPIRVLLDVGAQVLDLSNIQVAKAWLDCTSATGTIGAIYFSEDDKLMVLARNGTTQPLSSSPLAEQLHRCVAYLDDAHTRGTDLKFPLGFRAAVTLGHKVTKDRLVQGCMRMRKLGRGHSVMFIAPHEVDQRIRSLVAKENRDIPITTADILHWTIHETWNNIQRQAPHWAQQGMDHQLRYEAWNCFGRHEIAPGQLADVWVQPELKSLADMYMPFHNPVTRNLSRQIREHCESLGVLSLPDVRLDEEQEREVSREIERERETERPLRASPATHSLHPDIIQFVRTGVVPSLSGNTAFRHVFVTSSTASGGLHVWSPCILATTDFCQTIKESDSVQGRENDYLRPVQWVLSGKLSSRDALVLLSPFETDLLMPEIRISEHVHLHLYIPRTTKRMKPADGLGLYSVPSVPSNWVPPRTLIDQLNIFAGQLYLKDYASYIRLCRFLGVHTEDPHKPAGTAVMRNWLSNPDASESEIKHRFEGTPLSLVMHLLVVRRGMSFVGTHMGRILDGCPLTEGDFSDPGKSTTIDQFGQEQLGVLAQLISVDEGGKQTSRTTQKRGPDSEGYCTGRQSKRRRRN